MKNFEDYNIQSGEEYAKALIENLRLTDEVFDELPKELMQYWEEGIYKLCIEKYDLYIKGKADDYRLFENDMLDLYKDASLKMTQDILDELVDKGEIQMGINKDGEIVYGSKDWDMVKNKKVRRKKG